MDLISSQQTTAAHNLQSLQVISAESLTVHTMLQFEIQLYYLALCFTIHGLNAMHGYINNKLR